jgi:transposase InsO family protein
MVRNGETISDLRKIEKVLRTLTPKFDHIVVAKEESKNLDELKFEELQASLEAHELRLTERSKNNGKQVEDSGDQALQAQYKKGKFKKNKGKNQNSKNSNEGASKNQDSSQQDNNNGQKKKFNKKEIQCYNCQKWGHFAAECRSKKVPREKTDEAKFVHDNEGDDLEGSMLMAIIKEEDNDDQWYLDTGCSNHMSGKRTWFYELDEFVNRRIRFADDSVVKAEGIGKVRIQCKDGRNTSISDVLYVPTMKSNLISIGQLLEKGYVVKMEDKVLRVFDNKMSLILKAPMSRQRTFKIELNVIEGNCLSASASNDDWLWHQRYGHLNFGDLSKLQMKRMANGLPLIKGVDQVCDKYCISKQARSSYKTEVPIKATRKLEAIHSDVCGPFEVKSMGGDSYFVSFIDKFTRKLWIYLIAKKSEVFEVFKKFRMMVQNESGEVISKLRIDGGGEYTSNEFKSFRASNDINHEITAPYTPQHNGTAERKNKTIVNMVRSMIKEKSLPHYLWGEATATAAYLLNRCPTKRMENVTPEEAWSGVKPCVKHLRVFGSLYFRHIPDQLRRKLDDKAQPAVMVGYHSTGSYKLYDPIGKKVMFNKDVSFDESNSWNWEENSSSQSKIVYFDDTESSVPETNTAQ